MACHHASGVYVARAAGCVAVVGVAALLVGVGGGDGPASVVADVPGGASAVGVRGAGVAFEVVTAPPCFAVDRDKLKFFDKETGLRIEPQSI